MISTVYEFPEPVKLDLLPLLTVTSELVKSEASSENVIATGMGLSLLAVPAAELTVTEGFKSS